MDLGFGFGFGLIAFEVKDVVAVPGIDITGKGVLAVGGVATEDDAFELGVAQEQFALGAFRGWESVSSGKSSIGWMRRPRLF